MREPEDDPASCAGKRTQKQFTLKIRRQLSIVADPFVTPRSEVGEPFRMTLRARGGSGTFAWSLASGWLPAGIRISPDGSTTGTPRKPGTYRFTATVKDTEGRTLAWKTELSVAPRLRVQTPRLPAAQVGRRYRADLNVLGGVTPTVWKVTHGRLPRGIRLASTLGRLTGVPTEGGTQVVTLEVRDGLKVRSVKSFRIVVGSKHLQPGTTLSARATVP